MARPSNSGSVTNTASRETDLVTHRKNRRIVHRWRDLPRSLADFFSFQNLTPLISPAFLASAVRQLLGVAIRAL